MDGRSSILLIAATLAASALTGCIANPLEALSAETEVSAFENKAAADEAALAWSENAALVGVITFELTESPDPRIESDPNVGNGLAPAWWYVYCAIEPAEAEEAEDEDATTVRGGEEEATMVGVPSIRAFKVLADGTVTSEDDAAMMAEGFDHEAEPLVGWEADTDALVEAAKLDERFRKVAEGLNATLIEGLGSHEGKTAFFVSAVSADGWVAAVLDPKSGAILQLEEMAMDFAMPTFEYGAVGPQGWLAEPVHLEGEGTSNAGDELAEHPFTLVDTMHGMLEIEMMAAGPMDGLHWAILDSEGEWVDGDHLGSWLGEGGSYTYEFEIDDAGDYTFVIGYMSSAEFLPVGMPLGGAVDYSFVLDLLPGEMPEDEDEDEG